MESRRFYFDSGQTLERDGHTFKRYFCFIEVSPWDESVDIIDQDGVNVLCSSLHPLDQSYIAKEIGELRDEACAMFEIYHCEKEWA